jgi:hypothetical protein
MTEFRHHSARAVCAISAGGVSTVSFYGLVDRKGMSFLRIQVHKFILPTLAAVVRLDGALLTLGHGVLEDTDASIRGGPDAAVIVRDEDYEMGMAYARHMAGLGVKRLIFLPSQIALAHRWAEARVRSVSAVLPL